MKVYGRAAVSQYLGDQIVYRNLAPIDSRLPSLAESQPDARAAAWEHPTKK